MVVTKVNRANFFNNYLHSTLLLQFHTLLFSRPPSKTPGNSRVPTSRPSTASFTKGTPQMGTSLVRAPVATISHTRTITNVTQAQTRTIMSVAAARTTGTVPELRRATTTPSNKNSTQVHVTAGDKKHMRTTVSVSATNGIGDKNHVRTPIAGSSGAEGTRSPHSAHKHHHKRHTVALVTTVTSSSSPMMSVSAAVAAATLQHSMATNTTVTPPNVVIGSNGLQVPVCSASKNKDSEKVRLVAMHRHGYCTTDNSEING